jgi:pantothenate kinase
MLAAMSTPITSPIPAEFTARVEAMLARGGRRILGLAGGPGSGKSTLAEALKGLYGERAVVVPMDGYHLANSALQQLGRQGRKGAPDTFDADGYVALLQRLRQAPQTGETVYAPEYRREFEEGIAGAIAVPPEVQLVITEGNYLLMAEGAWAGVKPLLDEAWYVGVDDDLRRERLLARHMRFGRSREDALHWIAVTDEPNAQRIAATRHRADAVFNWADAT